MPAPLSRRLDTRSSTYRRHRIAMFLGAGSQDEVPWQETFPTPRTAEPSAITREDLLARFQAGQRGGRDFLLVDVRRTDHEVSESE